MTDEQELEKLLYWCLGNRPAASFLFDLGKLSQSLDDLVDETEKPVRDRVLWALDVVYAFTVKFPQNQFFQYNHLWLNNLLMAKTMEWSTSDILRRSSDENQKMFAFVNREAMDGIIVAVATHLGGPKWGHQVALEVNEFYHVTHKEDVPREWMEAAE